MLPLKEDAQEPVRALLADGPPFDPEPLGLDRHQVFLTAREAVFVFESELGAGALEPLLHDPELWQSAAAWHEYLAGAAADRRGRLLVGPLRVPDRRLAPAARPAERR